jgi:transcriptional regulator GlxA family with amidase domain
MRSRHVALYVYDDVEVLDFAGPFEVFSVTEWQKDPKPFQVSLVAEKLGSVLARNGLSINPHFTFQTLPPADIVIIPGGWGTRREMLNPATLNWVKEQAQRVEWLLTVCTGSLILAKAGLLDGIPATTHHQRFDLLQECAPACQVVQHQRVVQAGNIITSGGIAAGIDMSFYVVAKLLGSQIAQDTARYMEYHWQPSAP